MIRDTKDTKFQIGSAVSPFYVASRFLKVALQNRLKKWNIVRNFGIRLKLV